MGISFGVQAMMIYPEKISADQITKKLEAHRIWRKKDGEGQLAVFSKITVGKINLSGIDFSETIFYKVHFDETIFTDALFENTKFIECSFRDVDMSRARLNNIRIIDSFITSSIFTNAEMLLAEFIGTTCWNSVFDGINAPGLRMAYSSAADGSFENARLQMAHFIYTDIDYASFEGANCVEAKFIFTGNTEYADFHKANLTDAYFSDANAAEDGKDDEDSDDTQDE